CVVEGQKIPVLSLQERTPMQTLLALLPRLWANWLTLLGAAVTTMSGLGLLITTILELMSSRSNPYRSGFLIVGLPLLFFCGLVLIPLGFYVERRRRRRLLQRGLKVEPDPIAEAFTLAVKNARARNLIVFVGILTLVNITLLSMGGHSAA